MPVDSRSRYYGFASYTVVDARRGVQPAIPARLEVQAYSSVSLHQLRALEGMEQLAAQLIGDSAEWWRLADANPNRFALDLRPADTLLMPVVDTGQVTRTRRW